MYDDILNSWDNHYIELKKIILNNIRITVGENKNSLTFIISLRKTGLDLTPNEKALITEMIQSYLLNVFLYEIIDPTELFIKYSDRLNEPQMLQAAKEEVEMIINDYAGSHEAFYKLIWDYIEYTFDINPDYFQLS